MLMLLSPAKTLNFSESASANMENRYSMPDLVAHSTELVNTLKTFSAQQVGELMGISESLSRLNAERYAAWSPESTPLNAKQAVLTFNGDVYEGLDAPSFNHQQLDYLQSHLRILSGLYGVLRPLDLMQAYRLEMGTKLSTVRGKDLYAFWGDIVTEHLQQTMHQNRAKFVVNLASEEYFKVVKPALLPTPIITPIFEDYKNGAYKIISFYAKRARGLMVRYAALHAITKPEQLKSFDLDGYAFDEEASQNQVKNKHHSNHSATPHNSHWVFRRKVA